ncbi:MAG: glycosyltransferase, partial [Chloroflexi bacterium]|nr:glycosyltransferase [Chloroflexota bacterium]
MKVLHVPFCFRPDRVGGTEVYVENLAHEQLARGMQVVIAAPAADNAAYAMDGLEVRRFATGPIDGLTALYGAGDPVASATFGAILDDEQPDVVHLHAFTSAVSVRSVDEARRRGLGVVFTYHTPTVSCQRGTLLLHGREVCDGELLVQRCAECALEGLGAGRLGSQVLSRLPTVVGAACADFALGGFRLWTGVQYTHLVKTRHAAVRVMLARVQRVVVLCEWSRQLLVRNGVAAEKIVTCRHGLTFEDRPQLAATRRSSSLRVAFFGRLHPTKGADVLIRAVRQLVDVELELHVFGVEQPGDERYARRIRQLAGDDGRIVFEPAIPSEQVIPTLREFDLLGVPSQWLETGPLVVLEAFAARTPVIGSNLGGIAELVRDGVDGLLVQPGSVADWASALRRLAEDPALRERLRLNVRPPRDMRAVSEDML